MHKRHGYYTNIIQRDNHVYLRWFRILKNKWQNDYRHRVPEEFKNAKHANGLKVEQLRWANFGIGKFSIETYRMECTLKGARGNATKTPAKPHSELKIPIEFCEQASSIDQTGATSPIMKKDKKIP